LFRKTYYGGLPYGCNLLAEKPISFIVVTKNSLFTQMFAVVLISALFNAVLAVYNQWTWISGAPGTDGTAFYQNIGSYTKQVSYEHDC
jgi:UDP-N-acetylenolpyruvoylglucosamine reductase